MWEFLELAQLDIQISPALNNFWSPKWHDFLLCGRLILLALLRDPHSLGLGTRPLGGNLSSPHLGLGLRSRRGSKRQLCGDLLGGFVEDVGWSECQAQGLRQGGQ